MNYFPKMNMLMEEARRHRSDRFNPRYSAFPNNYDPYDTNDFVSDEMVGHESINYLEFDGFKNGFGHKGFGSTRRGRRDQPRGRWAGRGGPNRDYYNPPERGGHLPNHSYHRFPDQHIKDGRRVNLKRPDSQESTSKQGPGIQVESAEPRPVEAVQETSPPKKDLDALPFDLKSRRKEKYKLKRLRQKKRKAAEKAQIQLTAVTSQDVNGATAERQFEPELENRKRKEKRSADDEPKIKIVKTDTSEASKDSTDKMEAKRAASDPEAKGQSSVSQPINEELAQLKVKLQEKTNPLSGSDCGFKSQLHQSATAGALSKALNPQILNSRHPEETNKGLTSAPVGLNSVEQNSFGAVSSVQASKSTADGENCTEQSLEAKTDRAANSSEQQSRQNRNREKQRMYGKRFSAHRLTFVCQVCKFSSFYKWKLKAHLKSKFHNDHFKFLSVHLPKPTVDFLETHFSTKQQRVQDIIDQIPDHRATLCQVYEDQDMTLDISMEHFIKKAEAAHCIACDEYIPMQYYLIQLHLRSPDHRANCKGMMVQSKNLGLSTVQRLLRLKCTHQKLERYLKDTKRNRKMVPSKQQRAVPEADTMTQEAEESPCEQAMQADEAEEDRKDQEAKLLCGQVIQATASVKEGKTQEQEPVCVWKMQADGAVEEKNEVEPCVGQVIQGNEAVEEGKKQEAEPFCGLMMEADEAKEVVPATDPVINGESQTCEKSIPAAENLQEFEQSERTESLFGLLDEEDDLEGVELGEEEMGEEEMGEDDFDPL